ncbi:MAG: ATP-binding protein [Planctomycetota bacterium]|nr:ATP-binding protein [Planctomycetota bacterium]
MRQKRFELGGAKRFFGSVLAIVFAGEAFGMYLLRILLPSGVDPNTVVFRDAVLLTMIIAPALWALLIRPLREIASDEYRKYLAIFEESGYGIFTVNDRGIIETVNSCVEFYFETDRMSILGKPLSELFPDYENGLAITDSIEARIHLSKKPSLDEEIVVTRGDWTRTFEVRVSRLQIKGRIQYTFVIRDITQRKKTESDLIRAKEVADAANSSKSNFLANMSHEIRTPMTAILGYTELLFDARNIENEPEQRVRAVQTIQRNGEHLLSIIDDILDLSKIESDRLSIESIAYSPVSIVEEVLSLMRVKSKIRGIKLEVEYESPIPALVQTDPTRTRQIVLNLVSNAIKFTEAGSVKVIVRFVPGDEPKLQFDVVDTGLGMTREQQERLFKPFVQADSSTTRQFGGTGLGLTISKYLAEMLGGSVVIVDSIPGIGTRFRASVCTGDLTGVPMIEPSQGTLTTEVASTDVKVQPQENPLNGCRILLAEDGLDNQRLISFILKKAGAEITVVENGQLAVDAAYEASESNSPFHVLLMDMQMPVMDGYGATSLLRAKGYRGHIIALTAHAMSGDQTKCLNAGCSDYATKPIDRVKLVSMIASYFDRKTIAAPVCPSSNPVSALSSHV